MNTLPNQPDASVSRRLVLAEIALVFLVFLIQGAWPVPDVNEPHYLGKTIHYWNPDWVGEDFFLDSADTHLVFYLTFGWLSLALPPEALAWVGRLLTWALLAWAWRRLCFAVLSRPWWSVLAAVLWVLLVTHGHMAGEWVIGGVEAKGFAYVFLLLGIEAMVRDRWNRAWLCFGAATLFHVLVGGWAAVAAGVGWMLLDSERPRLQTMWPGLLGAAVLALPSLIPSLRLTWGVDPNIVAEANQIYVFTRLAHHLDPAAFPPWFMLRFAAMVLVWVVIRATTPKDSAAWRMHLFVAGTIVLAMLGMAIAQLKLVRPDWAAALLRFYWFRLADVMVPLGVALGGLALVDRARQARPAVARWVIAGAIVLGAWHLGGYAAMRPFPQTPRGSGIHPIYFPRWRLACQWIADPANIPPGKRFLTPRLSRTFKWYTGHSEVASWKDIPQDAQSIVEWWRRMNDIHAKPYACPWEPWHVSLADVGAPRLQQLAKRYQADYVLTMVKPRLDLPVVYENDSFIVYQLDAQDPERQ